MLIYRFVVEYQVTRSVVWAKRKHIGQRSPNPCLDAVRGEFVTSAENARDSGQSSTNTSNTQQHSQQLSSRVTGIIHFNS